MKVTDAYLKRLEMLILNFEPCQNLILIIQLGVLYRFADVIIDCLINAPPPIATVAVSKFKSLAFVFTILDVGLLENAIFVYSTSVWGHSPVT